MLLLKERNFSISKLSRNSMQAKQILKAIYALRKEVYSDLGWILHENSAQLVHDHFDDVPSTTHYAIFENERIVGSHRMTRYTSRFMLPFLKDGYACDIFGISYASASEANRLLLRQDKKYPGCAKQLLFNTTKYELEHHARAVVSLGDAEHVSFFQFMGYEPLPQEVNGVMDRHGEKQIVRKGFPLVATAQTLNSQLDLDQYSIKREFIIVS